MTLYSKPFHTASVLSTAEGAKPDSAEGQRCSDNANLRQDYLTYSFRFVSSPPPPPLLKPFSKHHPAAVCPQPLRDRCCCVPATLLLQTAGIRAAGSTSRDNQQHHRQVASAGMIPDGSHLDYLCRSVHSLDFCCRRNPVCPPGTHTCSMGCLMQEIA